MAKIDILNGIKYRIIAEPNGSLRELKRLGTEVGVTSARGQSRDILEIRQVLADTLINLGSQPTSTKGYIEALIDTAGASYEQWKTYEDSLVGYDSNITKHIEDLVRGHGALSHTILASMLVLYVPPQAIESTIQKAIDEGKITSHVMATRLSIPQNVYTLPNTKFIE